MVVVVLTLRMALRCRPMVAPISLRSSSSRLSKWMPQMLFWKKESTYCSLPQCINNFPTSCLERDFSGLTEDTDEEDGEDDGEDDDDDDDDDDGNEDDDDDDEIKGLDLEGSSRAWPSTIPAEHSGDSPG